MIYSLRKKFIKISVLSVAAVLLFIYVVIACINVQQMNDRADSFTDIIGENDGRFPQLDKIHEKPDGMEWRDNRFMSRDSEISTRFFTVWLDESGEITGISTDFISSVTEEEAKEFARKVLEKGRKRGWISYYRYQICETKEGQCLVFVDEQLNRNMTLNFMLVLGIVFLGSILGILGLIIIFSKRVVKPIAESYDKQKQFITDANHELKTPLTLVLTNLEILEAEYGKNEWIDDMRTEGMRMTELVNRLVTLTRMDEEKDCIERAKFSLGSLFLSLLAEFQSLADVRGIGLTVDIEPDVEYLGDEQAIGQLLSILMDNALKYCDAEGEIKVSLKRRRNIEIRVENSFRDVKNTELNRFFDRFYRSDRARTSSGSFGIGLSIAKAIVEKHKGEIWVCEAADDVIGFVVVLRRNLRDNKKD